MKTPELACSKCDATAAHYEITLCVECCENPLCVDCATAVQHELEVCSEACALAAIARLRATADRFFTRSLAHDRERGLPAIPEVAAFDYTPVALPARKVA